MARGETAGVQGPLTVGWPPSALGDDATDGVGDRGRDRCEPERWGAVSEPCLRARPVSIPEPLQGVVASGLTDAPAGYRNVTSVGTERDVRVPSPSCPTRFGPQQ